MQTGVRALVLLLLSQFGGGPAREGAFSLLVGVPRGVKLPMVDGMAPRKGSAKAPLLGLDEVVSMKWRHPIRAGLVSMKWSWGHWG